MKTADTYVQAQSLVQEILGFLKKEKVKGNEWLVD